ncbi:MAG TPA: sialidase family protein [Sedimentisphaerales bacterium]|nr:sialidase family protein [Sedimentisphaerales bacterium]
MRRMTKLFLFLSCICITGVSNLVYAAADVTALPAAVQAVVQREFAGATITEINDGEFDGTPVYEIEGTSAGGMDFELEVGKDGTLYQKDEKVRLQDVPAVVLATLKKQLGDVGPGDLKRMTEYGMVYYEIKAQGMGKEVGLKIKADGKILEKEVNGEKMDDFSSPIFGSAGSDSAAEPGSDALPLQYLGPDLPDKTAPDGRLMYSPGVQNIQVARANRRHPPAFPEGTENEKGWTYQHHVGIGEWKGKLYGIWDMTHVGEDNPPVRVVYATSDDGFHWTGPKDLYPFNKAYNSRFYFFHSSNDRMLVFASGWYPTDNVAEDRKDRLYVREITADHKLGEIYTLIKPAAGHPPAYTESKDAGFLQACREALSNKPLLEQADYGILLGDKKIKWHDGKNWPGGKIPSIGGDLWIFGKAMNFYHRKDGVLVANCKMGWATISRDEGETWSFPTIPPGIKGGGGKTWAQATPDGRYAMIYIPQDDDRYPMAVTTSDDGITFRDMRVIHGEVPPERYEGRAKPLGPQYLRGLSEWGSDGSRNEKDCIWTIYSVNKEDIWVSRLPVPIVAEGRHANDNFDNIAVGPRVPEWNTYSSLWAPVSIAADGSNHYLQLEDREPTDYARAIRTFPVSKTVNASFRVAAGQTDRGRLEVELLGELGTRPVRIIVNDHVTKADEWLNYEIKADCAAGKYAVAVNGRKVLGEGIFAEPSSMVYALSFRTGEYRGNPGERARRDIPNSEEPLENVVYRIDDVKTGNP